MSEIPPPNPPQKPPSSDSAAPVAAAAAGGGAVLVILAVLAAVAVVSVCIIGILIALLLPAIQAAREAARRAQSSNNVKQISLGLLNYETSHGHFPPQYTLDADGNRLHSWRTMILPYLEQSNLYDEVDLEKPWNDQTNSLATETEIQVFRSPRSDDPPEMTNYVAIAGEGFAFDGDKQFRLQHFRDGMSNTIMIVEIVNSTIPWAKPEDITLDDLNWESEGAARDSPNLVLKTAVVGYADGAVHAMSGHEDRQWLKDRLTRSGGERIDRE